MIPNKIKNHTIGIIPARFGSTRFQGKVLAKIAGKPMIQWVYERAIQAKLLQRVIVATDESKVKQVVEGFGGVVLMTSNKHETGTDRVAEIADQVEADVIVNIQVDEPLISPQAIDELIEPFSHDNVIMATLCRKANNVEEIYSANTVKVVFDKNHNAVYFSRAPIPFNRDFQSRNDRLNIADYFQHIGIYAYRKEFLLKLTELPQTRLEKIEKLEQLRALENGFNIKVIQTNYNPVCVDVKEDIRKVEELMNVMEPLHA